MEAELDWPKLGPTLSLKKEKISSRVHVLETVRVQKLNWRHQVMA
jgi:hypothetical protein